MIINTKDRWFGVLTEWVLYTGGRRWGSWVCSSQAVHGNGGLLKCNTKKVTSFSRERERDRQRGERVPEICFGHLFEDRCSEKFLILNDNLFF